AEPNPDFIPAIGSFAQVFGGPMFFFNYDNPNQQSIYQSEWRQIGGLAPDGSIDNSIGLPYQRPSAIAQYSQYARNATPIRYGDSSKVSNELPFANFGQYKNFHLQDPSIFNFYEELLDGPTKSEYAEWTSYNVNLAQTFLDNRVGFEVAYDYQDYKDGAVRMFQDQQAAINVDLNESWADGSPNPNAGRPFVSDEGMYGNNEFTQERDALRVTAFAEFQATDVLEESWLTRLLGRYVFTGLYAEDTNETSNQSWMRYGTEASFGDRFNAPNMTESVRKVNPVVYLGPSLVGRSSASGLNLNRIQAEIDPQPGPMLFFNTTWNAPDSVDPAATWINPNDPPDADPSTQSENPANYVGWDTYTVPVIDSEEGNRDRLTRTFQRTLFEVESWAIIGQAYWWDGAVVGTLGYREDTVKSYDVNPSQQNGRVDPNDAVLPDVPLLNLTDDSLSKSISLHLNRLPYGENLPFEISLYWNESENFQPAAGRRNILGQILSPPTGSTEDYSILLATKDNRFSFKVTKFETSVRDQSSSYIPGSWFIGGLEAWGNNWANIFELKNNNGSFGEPTGENTYAPAPGETEEEAAAREAAAIAGWRAHQDNVRALSEEITGDPNAFYETWSIDVGNTGKNAQSQGDVQGLTFTQDTTSEGYEFEFTANPTPDWRISFNASKTEAVRNNVGGAVTQRWVEMVENDLNNTPAGDLRIWWGGAGNPTTLQEWNNTFASNYALVQLQEGSATPEVREWRFNLVSNYSFSEGMLAGVNLGVGYRWQDDIIIGYPLMEGADGATTFDLDNPYVGPTEDAIDLWIGYERSISDSIDWRIQLNVRNLGQGDSLIPISTQPNGDWATVRIAPHETWFLTNTFSF
ncbi:MAG: TonB-dependent receptor, partial [Opitutales bacterium]